VILTGAGRAFSAGGDLDWIMTFPDDPAARDDSLREGAQIIEEMLRFPLPVIAAVNGAAVGLGASIAVLSDIVLISDRAFLADPHVSVGLVAGDGGAAFWPLLTPILRSREYLYTGDRIPAALAVELGLASRVVPGAELMGAARALAARLAGQPAAALRGTKRVANMYLSQALAGAVQAGFAAERETMLSPEHRARLLAVFSRGAQTSPPDPPLVQPPSVESGSPAGSQETAGTLRGSPDRSKLRSSLAPPRVPPGAGEAQ
jgi:enoyl-CoA hydratase